MKIRLISLAFLSICLWCCTNKNDQETIHFGKPKEEKLNSFERYLSDTKNLSDKKYSKTYTDKINFYINQGKIDSAARLYCIVAKTYYDNYEHNTAFTKQNIKFLNTYEKKIAAKYLSELYYYLGRIYYDKDDMDSSIYFLTKGIVKPTDYNTTFNNGFSYYILSVAYMNKGRHKQSIEAGLEAQKAFEMVGDIGMQACSYDAISGLYKVSSEYNEALKLNLKAYNLALLSKDTISILAVGGNRLAIYLDMNHQNFIPCTDTVINIANQFKSITPEYKMMIYSYKVRQQLKQNKIKEAKRILDEFKDLYKNTSDLTAKEHYELALSDYEVAVGKGSANVEQYESLIPRLTKEKNFVSLRVYYQILRDQVLNQKNFKDAFDYQFKLQSVEDSLSAFKFRATVKELDKKYQTEKKEKEISKQKIEIAKKNTFIYILSGSLLGLLLAGMILYLLQVQKNLKQQKENSMNFTKQLLENTEEERKRIASDLHDSISHELLNLKSIFSQDLSVVNKKIDTIINDIRGISRNLHPVMFDKIGLVPNVEQLVERIQNQNSFFISTDITYTGLLTSADELQIYRIIQEALTNIIKYAKAHAAKITVVEGNDKIVIEIRDNGKGFDVKQALNSGKAFGLHNIIERSRVIGGEANISSSAEGTVITINIPKKS